VEYHLTQMGREAGPVLDAVIAWSHQWIPLPADDTASHPGAPEDAAASHGTGRSGGSVVQ
jgi:DNA-binding HxlR family transcriptional regulator